MTARETATVGIAPNVSDALGAGRPVVALESSVLAQGLPEPANREALRRMTDAVRGAGAIPAVTGVVRGVPTVGMAPADLERFLVRDSIRKVSARDLPLAMTAGADGATTVAASIVLAHAAGIDVFATGGLGGVHRQLDVTIGPRDESADLMELARTPIVVVCAGMKSILDLEATMERLETLGVPVVGYRTGELPGFLTSGTGIPLSWSVDSVSQLAAAWRAARTLGREAGLLVVQQPPEGQALARDVVERAVRRALAAASDAGVQGAAVTPWLLERVERETGGSSLGANVALLERNAALAGALAVALAERSAAEQ